MVRSVRVLLLAVFLTAGSVMMTGLPVLAGCSVNVKFVNKDAVTAHVDLEKSVVKIQYGTWVNLGQTILKVSANGQKSKSFTHTFGCGINRRYKFYVTESGQGSKTIYKPNANDWTKATSLTVNINF